MNKPGNPQTSSQNRHASMTVVAFISMLRPITTGTTMYPSTVMRTKYTPNTITAAQGEEQEEKDDQHPLPDPAVAVIADLPQNVGDVLLNGVLNVMKDARLLDVLRPDGVVGFEREGAEQRDALAQLGIQRLLPVGIARA